MELTALIRKQKKKKKKKKKKEFCYYSLFKTVFQPNTKLNKHECNKLPCVPQCFSFEQGRAVWRYNGRSLDPGYPKDLSTAFPAFPNSVNRVTSAVEINGNGQTFLIAGMCIRQGQGWILPFADEGARGKPKIRNLSHLVAPNDTKIPVFAFVRSPF